MYLGGGAWAAWGYHSFHCFNTESALFVILFSSGRQCHQASHDIDFSNLQLGPGRHGQGALSFLYGAGAQQNKCQNWCSFSCNFVLLACQAVCQISSNLLLGFVKCNAFARVCSSAATCQALCKIWLNLVLMFAESCACGWC